MNAPAQSISVIIPCHNYALFLPEALASIAAQQVMPAEVILVDDGSSDDSAEVAAMFDPSIRIIRQPQQGIAGARNAGICATQGDLLAFIDADDIWPADSLAVRLAAFQNQPEIECLFGQLSHFICPRADAEVRIRLICPPGVAMARFAGTMLVRRSVFDRVGPFDASFRVGEMIDWVSRLEPAGIKVALIEHCVLHRRIHGSNTVLKTTGDRSDYLRALHAGLRRQRAKS
jgi:glycosyltransferase involved in cell wall biosynthesis